MDQIESLLTLVNFPIITVVVIVSTIVNSTIISIVARAMIVEVKPQPSTKVLKKDKEIIPSAIHKKRVKI